MIEAGVVDVPEGAAGRGRRLAADQQDHTEEGQGETDRTADDERPRTAVHALIFAASVTGSS